MINKIAAVILGASALLGANFSAGAAQTMTVAAATVAAKPLKDMTDPYRMIQEVAEDTFARFKSDKPKIDEDANYLKVIVEDELMPYINYSYASYKVLGSHYKKASKPQLAAFREAFRRYMITTYASVFTLYTNQHVTYEPSKDFSKSRKVTVKVRVAEPGRPTIKIDFKVRKNKKTGQWKAYDMVAEGISMLQSKQSELGGLLRKHGIEYVTNMLIKKAESPVVQKGRS